MDAVLDVAAELGTQLDARCDLREELRMTRRRPARLGGVRAVDGVGRPLDPGPQGARRPVLILPTASAAEGDEVFDRWARKGLDHYAGSTSRPWSCRSRRGTTPTERPGRDARRRRRGVLQRREPRLSRRGASRYAVLDGAARHDGRRAGLRGLQRRRGVPGRYRARQRRDDVRRRPVEARAGGLPRHLVRTALGHAGRVRARPDGFIEASVPEGDAVGIDENTAMVGDGVRGASRGGCVHVFEGGGGPIGRTAVEPPADHEGVALCTDRVLPRGEPGAAGSVRHPSPRRPHRRVLLVTTCSPSTTGRSSRRATCSSSPRPTSDGRPTCSYKGGDPGFVRVRGRAHAGVPELRRQRHVPVDGQRPANPHVGMLFIDFERGHRMRLERRGVDRPRRSAAGARGPRPSSWSGSARGRSSRTARATSTATQKVRRSRVRATRGLPDAGPGLEALRLGGRRAARGRPRPRPERGGVVHEERRCLR